MKKLYKSQIDKKICGVCGGIADGDHQEEENQAVE